MSLPAAEQLVLVDPVTGRHTVIASGFSSSLSGMALDGHRLLVTDTSDGGVRAIDLVTGSIQTPSSVTPSPAPGGVVDDPSFVGWDIVESGDGFFLVGEATTPPKGWVLRIDEQTLDVSRVASVGPGIGEAISADGLIWTTGNQFDPRARGTSVAAVDPSQGSSRVIPLPGSPMGIASDPGGGFLVSLYLESQVVEVDGEGRVGRAVDIPEGPWGIAVATPNEALVVAERTDRLYFLDLRTFKTRSVLDLGPQCSVPREVVVVDRSAVLTCVGLPGVVVVSLDSRTVVHSIRVIDGLDPGFTDEEPRGLTVIPPA